MNALKNFKLINEIMLILRLMINLGSIWNQIDHNILNSGSILNLESLSKLE